MDRRVLTSLGEVEVLEQLRVRAQDLYPEVVERYVAALRGGGVLPSVRVLRCGGRLLLVDGRHRIAAWTQMQMAVQVDQLADVADMGEALAVALRANTQHGEPRRLGDVARCIDRALEVWGGESDREIARRVGCSPTSVGTQRSRARRPVESGEVSSLDTPKPTEGQSPAWTSPWTPENVQVEEVIAAEPLDGRNVAGPEVDPQQITFGERMTELRGEEEDDEDGLSWSFIKPGAIRSVAEAPMVKEEGAPRAYRGRDALERWYTDPVLTAVCWRWLVDLDVLPEREVWTVLEPAVGDGAWVCGADLVRLGSAQLPKIVWDSCDLDGVAQRPSELRARGVVGDFLEVCWADAFDLVITNPPNSRSTEFVMRALELVVPGGVVAFLMPLSWYAAQGRRVWLEAHPPYRVGVCPWRPSFGGPAAELQGTKDKNAPQVYALFVWVEDHKGETVLEIIPGGEVGDEEE